MTGNLVYNRIVGNAGNNRIDGGLGKDELIGLGGNDTYLVDNAGDLIVEAAGGGIDTVESAFSYTLADGLSRGADDERLEAANVRSTAPATRSTTITGNAGRNSLDGGRGKDTRLGRRATTSMSLTA